MKDSIYRYKNLPTEVIVRIIKTINFISPQFLIDLVNILIAVSPNTILFECIIQEFKNKIAVFDLTNFRETIKTPFLQMLRDFFSVRDISFNSYLTSEFEKVILIIDDSVNLNDLAFHSKLGKIFSHFQQDLIVDIVYCPFFSKSSISDVLVKLSDFSIKIDNFILEFKESSIYTGTNLFGILSHNFFTFNKTNSLSFTSSINGNSGRTKVPWLVPRCNQISFLSVSVFQMDYLAIDRFIYAVIEQYSLVNSVHNSPFPQISSNFRVTNVNSSNTPSGIEYIFRSYLEDVSLFLPNLTQLKFINGKGEECCNFIDLSSLILNKLKFNMCPLKYLFNLHSFKNWHMPNISVFGGHRFKYDETTLTGSKDESKKKIRENVSLLHEFAQNETNDACIYFRIELFPKGTKKSRLLNWLPSENCNLQSYHNSAFQIDYKSDYHFSETSNSSLVLSKPILCLKCPSLKELELRLLPNDFNNCIYIQGLFLENLETLILQNYKSVSKLQEVHDKASVTVRPCNMVSFDYEYQNFVGHADEDYNINNVKSLGFSSWNYLPLCKHIRFTNNTTVGNENYRQNSFNIIFKISNLKKYVPLINLKESFKTYVSDEQKFIVI